MINDEASVRLNIVRFPLIARVVFYHAFGSTINLSTPAAPLMPSGMITELTGFLVARGFTVAFFFLLAGFLFFDRFEWSGEGYLRKARMRVKTLLVPFLFWNILWLAIIAVAQNLPLTSGFFTGGVPHFTESGVYEWINSIIGIDRHPIAFQFWFIRDLMLMVALAPVFHLFHRIGAVTICIILFGIWASEIFPENMPGIIPHPQTIFFFYLGSVIAVKKKTLFLMDRYGVITTLIFLVCAVVHAVFEDYFFKQYVEMVGSFAGLLSALYLTRFIYKYEKARKLFLWLGVGSFFVFAGHELTLETAQRFILSVWVPSSDPVRLLYYFALPSVYIAAAVGIFVLLKRYFPKFTSIITGMR